MREMSASEASRNSPTVLDAAERGETIGVHRGEHRPALVGPAPKANGKALLDVFERWRGRPELDEAFAENVAKGRTATDPALDSAPWRD